MKVLSKISLCIILSLFFISTAGNIFGQITYPRGSQGQRISQKVGDAEIKIVYHRPNVKGRKIWGTKEEKALVPSGEVWRAGANENTTFEVTQNSTINGQKLPKGKYGFHVIPNADEWIIIFNKVNNAWGSFTYKKENDALRVTVKPQAGNHQESLIYTIENVTGNSADVVLAWEKIRVPFKVDIGDVSKRLLNSARTQKVSIPLRAANYVLSSKLTQNYAEAISWVDNLVGTSKEGQPGYAQIHFNRGFVKSRLLAAMGKRQEAIALAEKTIALGTDTNKKAKEAGESAPFGQRGIGFLANLVKGWKAE